MASKILLSIETSGKICSVALCSFKDTQATPTGLISFIESIDFEVIAEYNINVGNKHDKFCAELCSRILRDNNVTVTGIDGVAVSAGPGSFTGLRIGLAVAKGLCFDGLWIADDVHNAEQVCPGKQILSIPLLAVPTLNAIAANGLIHLSHYKPYCHSELSTKLLAVIPSHANLFYHQLFDSSGTPISDIGFSNIDVLIAQFEKEMVFVGTNHKTAISFGIYIPPLYQLTATAIARVGAMQFINKQFANAADIQPFYVQDFVASISNKTNINGKK